MAPHRPRWGYLVVRGGRGERSRSIHRQHGAGLLETRPEGCEALAQRGKGISIKQRAHPRPQQAFAPQLCPHGSAEGTTALWRLVHPKRQQHHDGTHDRQLLCAMTVMVFAVVAWSF